MRYQHTKLQRQRRVAPVGHARGQFLFAFCCLLFALFTGSHVAFAQVQARSGVRSDAMGGAFVAVSNDVNGLQVNPAGLLNAWHRTQVGLGHHRLLAGLGAGDIFLTSVSGVHNFFPEMDSSTDRLKPKILAEASTTVLASPGINVAPDTLRHRFSFGLQWLGLNLPGGQNQNTFQASVGIGLFPRREVLLSNGENETMVQVPNRLALGLSLRYIRFGYDESYLRDPGAVNSQEELDAIERFLAANNVASSDFALDASLAFFLTRKLQAGVSVLNLRQPNLGAETREGKNKSPGGILGRRYRAGLAYRLFPILLTAVDVEKNEDAEGWFEDVNVFAGAELLLENNTLPLAVRSGFNYNWISAGFGLGLKRIIHQNLTFNGVYQYNLHGGDLSNFRFAVDFGWD